MTTKVAVCFVCLGNICRSPTAAGVMRARVEDAGLTAHIEIDSAGTGAWHVGEPPDERARQEAARRGVQLEDAARRFDVEDFDRFDLVVAMDHDNVAALHELAVTDTHRDKVHLLRHFDAEADTGAVVPDPYYGGPGGFADVFDLVDAACRGLLDDLRARHGW